MTLIALILNRQSALFQRHKSGIVLVVCALGFLTFMAAGAVMFMVVESDEFEKTQRDVLDAKTRILKKYPNTSGEALDEFLDEMRAAGVRGLPRRDNRIIKWRFPDSFFFVVTLLTTVGYGHFTPKTFTGKILCIAYTAIGIPITLVHLASYVDRLMKASERYKIMLFRIYQDKIGSFYIRFMHTASLMSFLVLICFILPSAYFVSFEKDWGMFDGIYCCFISLTTVGLGDMVPALDPKMEDADFYKYSASFYLIAGVTLIMFMMSMCGDFYRNFKNDYPPLPFTISTEKFPINPGNTHTYGSIFTQNGKNEVEEKCLLKS